MAPARVPVYMPISKTRAICRNGRLSVSIFWPFRGPRWTVWVSRARQHVHIRRAASSRVSHRSRAAIDIIVAALAMQDMRVHRRRQR
jgi:hypothetical protein